MKRFGFMVVLLALGCSSNRHGVLSVTGQIEGIGVDVGSRVGGRVSEVPLEEGAHVKAGDVLLRLESDEADAAVAAAEARLAQAEAALERLTAGARLEEIRQAEAAAAQAEEQYRMAVKGARSQEIDSARALADAARAQRDQALADFRRTERLYAEAAVSQQLYDKAKHAHEAAEAQYKAAREQLDLLLSGTRAEQVNMAKAAFDQAQAFLDLLKNGARSEDVAAARAVRDMAAADVERAKVAAREMVITSPRDGVIESLDLHPGDLVKPGAVARIVDPDDLELIVYVGAWALGKLRLGQEVVVTTDSLGAEEFKGVIAQIATEGEYTPRNLQTQEERVQQVFGIKVKLDSAGGKLRAGMGATAHLNLQDG